MTNPLVADLVASLDPVAFASKCEVTPHAWQTDALRSVAPRECWVVGRQCGKSTAAGLVAVHTAIYRPGSTTIMLSPGQRQSNELFQKAKTFYRRLGKPAGSTSDSSTQLETESGSRIISLPGTGATVRSYSADLVLVDEASRVDEETWTAVRPFVAMTGGRIVLLSTPWTRDGFFADAAMGRDPGWLVRTIKAESVLPQAFLDQERAGMAPADFDREYGVSFDATMSALWTEQQWRDLFDPAVPTLQQRIAQIGGSNA